MDVRQGGGCVRQRERDVRDAVQRRERGKKRGLGKKKNSIGNSVHAHLRHLQVHAIGPLPLNSPHLSLPGLDHLGDPAITRQKGREDWARELFFPSHLFFSAMAEKRGVSEKSSALGV